MKSYKMFYKPLTTPVGVCQIFCAIFPELVKRCFLNTLNLDIMGLIWQELLEDMSAQGITSLRTE
jgi:hypothetical protein